MGVLRVFLKFGHTGFPAATYWTELVTDVKRSTPIEPFSCGYRCYGKMATKQYATVWTLPVEHIYRSPAPRDQETQ